MSGDGAGAGPFDNYFRVIAGAGGLRSWDELVGWVRDSAAAIDAGSEAIAEQMEQKSLGLAEGWALLDSAKAIVARHLMVRRTLQEADQPADFLIARSDPDALSAYLTEQREHRTAVVSLHLLGSESLVVIVAANFPLPGRYGSGGTFYNMIRVNKIRDTLLPAVDAYAASVDAGRPDFAVIREPLTFLGRVLMAMLGGAVPFEIIFIPHRSLHVLPLHALQLADDETVVLHDIVSVIRYCTSMSDLVYGSMSISEHRPTRPHVLSVVDDTVGLAGVEIEKRVTDVLRHQAGEQAVVETLTAAADLPTTFTDHSWINWNSHARSSSTTIGGSYLSLGDSRITAESIASRWRLPGRPHVVLAACQTALDTAATATIDEYCGLDLAFRVAGARTVTATMWRVADPVAAFVSMMVTAGSLQHGTEPARTVTRLQRAMHHGTWQQALLRPDQLRQLPPHVAELVDSVQAPFRRLPANAFADPACWAVFRCHG